MNEKDSIAVVKVTIKLGDVEMTLTLDQLRRLKKEVLELMPEPYPVYVPALPWSYPQTWYSGST